MVQNKKVLLIAKDEDIGMYACRLRNKGYTVMLAHSIAEFERGDAEFICLGGNIISRSEFDGELVYRIGKTPLATFAAE